MGLFSKKRLVTATQVLHMVEDTPNIMQQSILQSIKDGREIVPDMLDAMNNCLVTKTDIYHKYAAKHYTNKLPEGSIGFESIDTSIVKEAVNEDIHEPTDKDILIIAAVVDEFDFNKECFNWLVNNEPTWDELTLTWMGKVSDNPEVPLAEITFSRGEYKSATEVILIGTYLSYSSGENGSEGTWESIPVSYTIPISLYTINSEESYYIAEYVLIDKADPSIKSQSYFWQYPPSNGKHPELRPVEQKYSFFMPVVPVRINNEDYAAEDRHDTELYKTSVKLLDKLQLKFDQIAEGINANPDAKDIDHAYFVTGVNPKSDKAGVAEYLYRLFGDMEAKSVIGKPQFENWFNNTGPKSTTPPINKLTIRDDTYYTVLCWNYVERKVVEGSIGKVGKVTKFVDGSHGTLSINIAPEDAPRPSYITIESPDNIVRLRKQISKTHYQELTISGLMFSNRIYGPNKDYISTLGSKEGEEIIIPLNVDIINDMDRLEANTLMYDALIMVCNAYEWKKLKWYQTGFFKIVTIVVAVVIAWWTGYFEIVAAAVSAGAVAVATLLAQTIVYSIIASAVFKFAAKELGVEFAMIIAVIAMIYGLSSNSFSIPELPFATEILSASMQMMDAVVDVVKETIETMTSEFASYAEEVETQLDKINEMNKELNPTTQLDPLSTYRNVGMLPNESCSGYIDRTLAFPSLGIYSIQTVSNYVDTSLNLDIY